MKLVGFVGNDFNVDQLETLGATIQHHGTVNGVLVVVPYNAYIQFDSYDETRYRPYLQLDAEIHGGRGQFGNDITEFTYREDDRLNRSVRYDFTDRELALLVEKGLYYPDFEVPSIFTDTEFEVPMDMEITEVELNGKRLVYASFDMISDLQTDSDKSGYDLVSYFEVQQFDREHVQENSFEYESQAVEHEVQDEVEKQEVVEVQSKNVVEKYEPVVVYEDPINKFAAVEINDVLNDSKTEIEDIMKDETVEVKDVKSDMETEAPKEPTVSNHGIRNVTDEYDAGKARQNEINREAVDEKAEAEFMGGGLSGGEPEMDQPDI